MTGDTHRNLAGAVGFVTIGAGCYLWASLGVALIVLGCILFGVALAATIRG